MKAKTRKNKPKRITLADLAVMVANSFAHASQELRELRAEMNERFESIDERFLQVDGRFQKVEDRFQSVEMKILGVNNRIDILIDRTPSREEFDRLKTRVATLETRRRR